MTTVPPGRTNTTPSDDLVYSFDALRGSGVLWAVNRVLLHPRGLSLALGYSDGSDEPVGWALQAADGRETWRFTDDMDHEGHRAFEDTITAALAHGHLPTPSEPTP